MARFVEASSAEALQMAGGHCHPMLIETGESGVVIYQVWHAILSSSSPELASASPFALSPPDLAPSFSAICRE